MFDKQIIQSRASINWRQEPDLTPVRKVVTRSTHRVVGYHFSKKMRCLIPWESQIEKLYLELLEIDPDVLQFYVQPLTIDFADTSYTPDVLVVTRSCQYFVEVKPDSVFEDAVTLGRLRSLQKHFREFGSDLKLVTKRDLVQDPIRTNVKILMRLIRQEASEELTQIILKRCEHQERSIHELVKCSNGVIQEIDILRAVAHGLLWLDLNLPISDDTAIQLCGGRRS